MLGGVPIMVMLPPSSDAQARGMSSLEGGMSVSRATLITAGSRMATAPMLFIKADMTPTVTMISTVSRNWLSACQADHLPGDQVGHAAAGQAAADDEHRPDSDHRRAGKARKRLFDRDQPGQHQGRQHDHGHHVDPQLFADEQDHGDGQNAQDQRFSDVMSARSPPHKPLFQFDSPRTPPC